MSNSQIKFQYFIAYYKFCVRNIDVLPNIQLENHKSLLQKIQYQLQNTFNEKNKYLSKLLENSLLRDYLADKFELNQLTTNNNCTLGIVEPLLAEIESNYLSEVYKLLIHSICCNCELKNKRELIEHNTNFLVSELFFMGFSYHELYKVPFFFKENEIEDLARSSKYPFPQSILDTKNDTGYRQRKEEYLKEILEGNNWFAPFLNLIERKKIDETFYFHIEGVETENDDFLFSKNDVKFISNVNEELIELEKRLKELNPIKYDDNFLKDFFHYNEGIKRGKYKLIAKITVETIENPYPLQTTLEKVLNLINNSLAYLNRQVKTSGIINTDKYIFSTDLIGWGYNLAPVKNCIFDREEYKLENLDTKVFLKDVPDSSAKETICNLDNLYIDAINGNNPQRAITNLIQYLESIFGDFNNFTEVTGRLPNILLLNEESFFKYQLLDTIYREYVWNVKKLDDDGRFNYFEKHNEIFKLFNDRKYKETIIELKRIYESDSFLKRISKLYRKTEIVGILECSAKRNDSLLVEAYSIRNAYLHSGKIHEVSNISVENGLFSIVNRFRWLIFDKLKSGSQDLNTIIIELETEGKKVLPKDKLNRKLRYNRDKLANSTTENDIEKYTNKIALFEAE